MIENKQYRVKRSEVDEAGSLLHAVERLIGKSTLRWYIGQITKDEILLEATNYEKELSRTGNSVEDQFYPGKSAVLSIIPTGIGCSIGGYAGDAAPATNLLASTVDYLITNPNAVNASNFIGLGPKVVYTDGCSMDMFAKGQVNLYLPVANKIGLIIEKAPDWQLDIIFNVVNTTRAVHGVDIVECLVTEQSIGGRCIENSSGAFVGTMDNPQVLFRACENLIQKGVTAIAVTSNIQDLPLDNYAKHFAGEYANPIGGVEAIISYSITRRYQMPAAHAPLMNIHELDLMNNIVDARGAGEFASASGLACLLVGLRRAPQINTHLQCRLTDVININNVLALVSPASALGGVPVLYAQKYNIPIIAVQENETLLDITQEKVQLKNVREVRSYAEAAGVIMAMKQGINLESLSRPLRTLRY